MVEKAKERYINRGIQRERGKEKKREKERKRDERKAERYNIRKDRDEKEIETV